MARATKATAARKPAADKPARSTASRQASPKTGPHTEHPAPAGHNQPTPSKDEMLGWYREMLLIRRFEERAGQLYGMGLIGGFCHLYIGQEAIAVGVESIKRKGDEVITGYRAHGHTLAAGVDPRR